MRQKIFIFLLAIVVLFSQVNLVDAKGSIGGGRSGGFSSGSHSSRGFSGSSSSKSSGGFLGSSSSKSYSGSSSAKGSSRTGSNGFLGSSSSRGVPDSYSSKSTSGGGSSKTAYMQDTYSKQASGRNYNTYKQNLTADQESAKASSFNRSYNIGNRMSFEDAMATRDYRINNFNSRPILVNVNTGYFGGPLSYGSASIGCWDLWFLTRASDMFWYQHWNDIYPYQSYFQAAQFADMQARVQKLEQQNIAKDSSYLDPDVDPDLQFSDEYNQNNPDKVFYTNKNSAPATNPFAVLFSIFLIIFGLILIIRFISRPRPRESFKSRIY